MNIPSRPAPVPALVPARMHEAQGRGRHVFALFQAAHHMGPVFWILPAHMPMTLMPQGLPADLAERLFLLRPAGAGAVLWAAEEVLRAGLAGLVIAETTAPLTLTLGRRLQLAAKEGQTTALMLIRDGTGSNAAQTRWDCMQIAGDGGDSTRHRWDLIKNKSGTVTGWILDWDGTAAAFDLVCEAGKQPLAPGASGRGGVGADPARGTG